MATEYTITVFGRDIKYRKVNGKFYKVKADGTLTKDAATGLRLANLKNAADSRLVKVNTSAPKIQTAKKPKSKKEKAL